jgi:hypothetical protein
MKLSKNRLNKIKAKKNPSRKKFPLRNKNKGKYEKTQKKRTRNTHIKQKTLKIYIGGAVKKGANNKQGEKTVSKNKTVPNDKTNDIVAENPIDKTVSVSKIDKVESQDVSGSKIDKVEAH